jgi:hypothetical protein
VAAFAEPAVRAFPAVLLVVAACSLAWFDRGTIATRDWLGYAFLAGLLVVTMLGSARVYVYGRLSAMGQLALFALAAWCAVSLSWSPLPTLGREEVLLVAFYTVVLAVPLLLVRRELERELVLAGVAAGIAIVAVASAAELYTAPDEAMFRFGRLVFPVSYVNANAAFFLIGFWPAVALAARRETPLLARAASVGAGTAMLAGWLATQSKGAGAALGASAAVFLALTPGRLRLLVPTLIAAAAAGTAFSPLTSAFRADPTVLEQAARDTGRAWLLVAAAGFFAGLAYAAGDRWLVVGPRLHRAAGAAAIAALALAVIGSLVGFMVAVDDPPGYVRDRIEELKGTPTGETTASHFGTLESQRYDVWRVAVREIADHPIAGIGSRGFYAAYLEHGRTLETPARAHSLPLDALAETGVIGLVLLLIGVGAPLAAAARDVRASPAVAAAFAACVYWLVHASVDWIWTLPASGIVFFVLLGTAGGGGQIQLLSARVSTVAAAAVAAVTLAVFGSAWLSARYLAQALNEPAEAARADLDRARTLDPLSTTPYVVEAQLAGSARDRVAILRRAVEKEPRSAGLRLLLGVAYRDAGQPSEARRELERAHELAPRDGDIERLLRRLE